MNTEADARTVPEAIARAARLFPECEAVVDGTQRWTYAQLHERVKAVARMLIAEGVGPLDRVAICSPNTHHWIFGALGALHCGATLVPVNTRFTGPEMFDVLQRSRARALVVAGPFLGTDRLAELRAAAGDSPGGGGPTERDRPVPGLPELRTVVRVPVEPNSATGSDSTSTDATEARVLDWSDIDHRASEISDDEAEKRASTVDPEQISDVLFTSGTTGRSKGAMSSHRQVLDIAEAWTRRGELSHRDRYLVINPFFHSFGYKAGILASLLRGTALVPQPVFDVRASMELVERERITVLPAPPTVYQEMLDSPDRAQRDLSALRLAVTGTATVPVALVERMQRELSFSTVLTAYGLTEAVVATMCQPGDPDETVSRTSGNAAAGFEVRVVDSGGEPAITGESGEILLRGPNVMRGYLDAPEATREAIDDDGWLHTGDVGRLDEHGYLTITDRIKDMYICGGFNVYPAEVEQELARLDGVTESAVVGVGHERLGEVGKAYVIARPDAELSTEDVIGFCRGRLANYKVPRHVEFRSQLPRNSTGKVLKYELRTATDS